MIQARDFTALHEMLLKRGSPATTAGLLAPLPIDRQVVAFRLLPGELAADAWSAVSPIYGRHWALVALSVGLALVGIVLWGTLAGSMLPIILQRLGFDPAASSARSSRPWSTSPGLVSYFSVAIVVLRATLL